MSDTTWGKIKDTPLNATEAFLNPSILNQYPPFDELLAALGQRLDSYQRYPTEWFIGKSILDVGCGLGEDLFELNAIGHNQNTIYGLDLNPDLVSRSKALLEHFGLTATLQVAEADALPFAPNSIDIVTCKRVLQHLSSPTKTVAGFFNICKPNGHIFLCEPDRGSLIIHSHQKETTRKIIYYLEDVVATPWAGRALLSWLQHPQALHIDLDTSSLSHLSWTDANRNFGFDLALPQMVQKGILTIDEARSWQDEQLNLTKQGAFYCMSSMIRAHALLRS